MEVTCRPRRRVEPSSVAESNAHVLVTVVFDFLGPVGQAATIRSMLAGVEGHVVEGTRGLVAERRGASAPRPPATVRRRAAG
jgi:hypothetical protein